MTSSSTVGPSITVTTSSTSSTQATVALPPRNPEILVVKGMILLFLRLYYTIEIGSSFTGNKNGENGKYEYSYDQA